MDSGTDDARSVGSYRSSGRTGARTTNLDKLRACQDRERDLAQQLVAKDLKIGILEAQLLSSQNTVANLASRITELDRRLQAAERLAPPPSHPRARSPTSYPPRSPSPDRRPATPLLPDPPRRSVIESIPLTSRIDQHVRASAVHSAAAEGRRHISSRLGPPSPLAGASGGNRARPYPASSPPPPQQRTGPSGSSGSSSGPSKQASRRRPSGPPHQRSADRS